MQLELSGPKLALAFESLVMRTEDSGGIERYVDALKLKSAAFAEALGEGKAREASLDEVRQLCAYMSTVRRRIGPYVAPEAFEPLRERLALLLDGAERTATADARIDAFCAGFPKDRDHRWVRDLASEVLHQVDCERYPLMSRWVWDARTNTGVLREIWHAEDIDRMTIDVPDRYETFLTLRSELSQFLAANGVFRDVLQYTDLLLAQVYAGYIQEQGSTYIRADFATPEMPMLHVQRLLGLDGIAESGRTKLKAVDGTAFVVEDLPRLN